MQLQLGAQVMTSTVVIGAIENNNASKDANESLSITSEEASWFGKYININTLIELLNKTTRLIPTGYFLLNKNTIVWSVYKK